jgi:2-polyprenyl-3-methyl-5-hydroxy-6-metoxy-1,4-benzoquinol methylase
MHANKRSFDLAALTWDENPRRIKLNRDIFSAIDQAVHIKPGMPVLDFGCGTGLLSLQIHERTGCVTCADSSAGMIEVLESKLKAAGIVSVRAIHLESDDTDGLPGKYDLITSAMTFHHIRHVQSLVQKLAGRLNPGGTLCVADLDPDGGEFHEDNSDVHHHGFTREDMMQHFSDAGLINLKSATAASVEKRSRSGELKTFTVFLISGEKS